MELNNFGAILSFAESLEAHDRDFYRQAAELMTDDTSKNLFLSYSRDAEKHIKTCKRTRSENVTEMILENIEGFSVDPYEAPIVDIDGFSREQLIQHAMDLEARAVDFYTVAAQKLKALAEVSRALKRLSKKRSAHGEKLNF